MKLVYEKIFYIRRISIVTTFAELLLGCLLIVYFCYTNYKPFDRIIRSIQRFRKDETTGTRNAYTFIEGNIGEIIQRNYLLQGELQKNNALLKAGLLERLLDRLMSLRVISKKAQQNHGDSYL